MFRFQYALGATLLAAAVVLTTPSMNAQQAYKGNFHLPFETYWAGTVLEPGDYTVSLEGGPVSVLKVSGPGGNATILAGPTELTSVSSHGRLTLVNVNGVYALREFDAGSVGKSFSFGVPKSIRDRANAAQTAQGTTAVITVQDTGHDR